IPLDQSNTLKILSQQFTEKFNIFIKNISLKIFDTLIDLGENIIALAVVPVLTYYFLAYSDMLCNRIAYLIPVGKRAIIRKIGKNIDKILGKYILGQLILSVIVGVMTFIAMVLLKIKFPLLVSIFNALLNIIPYFGAILGMIPAILVAIMDGSMKVVWVIIAFIIIQQIEGNIISPQITASSINMHPLAILILLLIGDKLGGLLGMILIIPIAVVIKVIYEDLDYYLF
ncbi:AI-2E family transporter, partial [Clostridium tarantellae]